VDREVEGWALAVLAGAEIAVKHDQLVARAVGSRWSSNARNVAMISSEADCNDPISERPKGYREKGQPFFSSRKLAEAG
jgi:hypothetical protein